MQESTAQVPDTLRDAASSKLFFAKAQKQKTAAWIFLGAGAGLVIIGGIVGASAQDDDPNSIAGSFSTQAIVGGGLVVGGTASILASVPFFIASGKNKRRAELSLKSESTFMLQPFRRETKFLSIGMNITLNKF